TRDELLYLPRNKRSFKAYGYSPVEQVIVTVSTAIRKAIYQMQYYTEGSTPDLILAVPADWQTDQIKEFKTYWDNLMQGNTANRRGTMFVANGTKVIDTKENALKDDFDEWIARVICFVFSIPPTPFIKQMNRATAQTAQESAQEEGLEPLKQWVVNVVNMIVVRFFGYNDIEFAWQEEQVVDPAQQAEVNDVYLKNGTLSVDEVREELGLDPIGMGNAVYTTQGYVLLKDILNPQPDPASIPSGDNLEIDSTDPAQKLLKTSPSDDSLGTNAAETALSGETYSVLRRAARKISRKSAKKLKELGYTEEKMSEAEAESLSADVVKALDLSVLDDLAEPYADELTIVATGQAEKALTSLGVSTDLPFPEAEDYARNRGAELVGKKWVDGELVNNPDAQWVITDTTRDMLKTEIQDAITNGLTMDELTAQLTDSHAFSEVRAAMIARTEVARATSMGSLAGYAVAESQGVKVKKKWVTAGDDKVDTSMCAPNAEAGAIALKSDFPSGDLTPPAHPNCRCSIVPVIDKE
ncbi:MAG: phage portal protein, partial [Pseudomonadota bacterium]|nr:phage portal protein [Pseudomonadota bacterium]